jgi:hypothetical protein
VNDLLLPLAGGRGRESGALGSQGAAASYWSSSPYGGNAYYLTFHSDHLYPQNYDDRALGFSVRCFKNSPESAP